MLEYLALYVFGLLKTPLLSPISQVPPNSQYLDEIAEIKFLVNSMSPEEVLPMFYPQIYNVSSPDLSDAEWPEPEVLQRSTLKPDQIYVGYNALYVSLIVGPSVDPQMI